MNILLLRNREDSESSVKNLKAYYPDAHIYKAPLFRVSFQALPKNVGEKALIITSKNALRSFKRSEIQPCAPLFIVGSSSCQLATEMGYEDIIFGGQNAQQLAEKVQQYADQYSSFHYLHGDEIRFDIKKYLEIRTKQDIQKIKAYTLQPIENPFEFLPASLFEQNLYVFFYSARQAMQFIRQCESFSNIRAICISAKVAEHLQKGHFSQIEIAANPTELAMIEQISNQ